MADVIKKIKDTSEELRQNVLQGKKAGECELTAEKALEQKKPGHL